MSVLIYQLHPHKAEQTCLTLSFILLIENEKYQVEMACFASNNLLMHSLTVLHKIDILLCTFLLFWMKYAIVNSVIFFFYTF